jgi:hypothetical protein
MAFLKKSKVKGVLGFLGKKKPSVKATTPSSVHDQKAPKQQQKKQSPELFQREVITAKGEDIEHNITVDTVESFDVSHDEHYEKSVLNQISIDTETEGTELILPSAKNSGIPPLVIDEEEEYPDDEPSHIPPAKISVQEQQQHRDEEGQSAIEQSVSNHEEVTEGSSKVSLEVRGGNAVDLKSSATPAVPSKRKGVTNDDDDDITENNDQSFPQTARNAQQIHNAPSVDQAETVAGKIMKAFTWTVQDAENCATLPGNLGGIALPATACQPIINQQASIFSRAGRKHPQQHPTEYYNDQFAAKFLTVSEVPPCFDVKVSFSYGTIIGKLTN